MADEKIPFIGNIASCFDKTLSSKHVVSKDFVKDQLHFLKKPQEENWVDKFFKENRN